MRITRIDYEGADERAAVVMRVENAHVPPLGVTWVVIPKSSHGIGPDVEFTSRAAAERHARSWCDPQEPTR